MNVFVKKEKCLLITALLISFTSWGRAETIVFKDGKNLGTNEIESANNNTLRYGMVTVHYGQPAIDKIVLDRSEPKIFFPDPFMASVVEASIPSDHEVTQACLTIHKKIKNSNRLTDLKESISSSAYQLLQQKIKAGASEITVLELLKNFMPERIFITDDVRFENDKAKLAVSGQIRSSTFNGLVTMIREDGIWKLDNEVWFGDDRPKASVKNSVQLVDFSNIASNYKPEDLVQWYDPYSVKRKNPLHLKKAIIRMPKESFFLFFFIDRDSKKLKSSSTPPPPSDDLPQLHLAWSGSFKTLEQQKLPGRYPLDITVAQEKDGYMPGTMNLRLPGAKPKQFYVGVLYSF